jgi:hypothetical protein
MVIQILQIEQQWQQAHPSEFVPQSRSDGPVNARNTNPQQSLGN